MIGIPADCTNDVLEIRLIEIGRSQVLNHVVKDEESELLALLLRACEAVWNNFVAQPLYQPSNAFLVRFEELAHQFGCRNL